MAPGPLSVSTAALLATLGGYGWWGSTVELAAPVLASGPLALQACATAAAAAETCLHTSAIVPAAAVAKNSASDARPGNSKKQTETPTLSKVLICVCLFLFEAIFLYGAGQSLGIGQTRRSTHPTTPVDQLSAALEENLPSDLGCVEPTLQPESKDLLDSCLPIFDSMKDNSAVSSARAPKPACELAYKTLAEGECGEETMLKVASPVRRSSRVE